MLYTIGDKQYYDKYIDEDEEAQVGLGQSVWLTYDEAKNYRDVHNPEYEIYGVLADWMKDTRHLGEQTYRLILLPVKVIRLDHEQEIMRKDKKWDIQQTFQDVLL